MAPTFGIICPVTQAFISWPGYLLALSLYSFLMSGCATSPVPRTASLNEATWQSRLDRLERIDEWVLAGRVAISNEEDSWTASLNWIQMADDYEIRVTAPLGQGSALLEGDAGGVKLHFSNGEVATDRNAGNLLYNRLGWRMPLEALRYWVLGMPSPEGLAQRQLDDAGRMARLEQSDWRVRYKRYAPVLGADIDLPTKVFMARDDWQVRLVVDDWQLAGALNSP